jgi:polysaccharide export outer membrane protein
MKRLALASILLAALGLGFVFAQDRSAPAEKDPASPNVGSDKAVPEAAEATYVIGAADVLLISVWKEPDLTATLPVRPDGMISVPLLNDVQAAGLTPMQLAGSLRDKLKKFVADPRVTVVVSQMNSQRIYVTGEVRHTGAMPLLPGMTVLQALASSGLTQFANTKAIYVLRSDQGKQQRFPVNYKSLLKGESSNRNILLRPGDTIVVP